jgi:hypothetical protein
VAVHGVVYESSSVGSGVQPDFHDAVHLLLKVTYACNLPVVKLTFMRSKACAAECNTLTNARVCPVVCQLL